MHKSLIEMIGIHLFIQCLSFNFTFVENTPHSSLFWQQPAVEARNLLEVRTSANKQQPKHQNAVKGVNYGREKHHCEEVSV